MQIFNSGLFWFVEGIIFCIVTAGFYVWMKDRGVNMNVGRWLAYFLWIFFLGFTIAFAGTSLGENEPSAALKGGILFGLITIISGAGLWRFLFIKPKSGKQ